MTIHLDLDRAAVRRARLLAGLTQSGLAAKVGVHPITMTRWETGTIRPRPDTIKRLARALGVDMASICTISET